MVGPDEYMDTVAGQGCVLCDYLGIGFTPAQLHHPRVQQGAAERAPNLCVVPLCPEHHTGATGVHGLGVHGFAARYRLDELDLLAMTLARFLRAVRVVRHG